MAYVVYFCERLRDGREEGARVVDTVEEGLALIERYAHGYGGCNTTFRLFELGREIPLERETVEEPQPAKVRTRFKVKGD